MAKNRIITVQNVSVTVSTEEMDDYICITDMAAAKSDNSRAADVIKNWIRSRSTLEFLGTRGRIAYIYIKCDGLGRKYKCSRNLCEKRAIRWYICT